MNKQNSASSPAQNLQSLLQAAIDVELFTIPLYMTAAYSLRFTQTVSGETLPMAPEPIAATPAAPISENQNAFNILFSVFVQEMLHLEMACNLSNALGFPPTLSPPDYTKNKIPHIKAPPASINVALGPLDDDRIKLFEYIETPDFKGEDFPLTEPPEGFETIGALYKAMRHWVVELWDTRYNPNSIQQAQFTDVTPPAYTYETISGNGPDALVQAQRLMDEIVVQGEGADAAGDVPVADQPNLSEEEKSKYPSVVNDAKVREYWDKVSHYARFKNDLEPLVQTVTLWPGNNGDLPSYYRDPQTQSDLQTVLGVGWGQLLSAMNASFQKGAPFPFAAMRGFNSRVALVWASGGVPEFPVVSPPQNEGKEIFEMHVCQGLNACQGHGRNDTGTGPGDGDCATATFHDCGNSNSCRGQGGCGWNVQKDLDNPDNWLPGENSCTGYGGCGAPIPAQQVFHGGPYDTANVWAHARVQFEARMQDIGQGANVKPAPATNDLRKALLPT